jgi:ribonuclease D
MSAQSQDTFILIDNQAGLEEFRVENKEVDWLAFDTEFVGEKRFHTRICLIQVATENGNYLIDPFEIQSMDALMAFITDPNVIKVTHAGENDYRLFYANFNVVPVNTFDTQIAAGFLGYKYPVSFQKLVQGELNVYLKKGYAVADWEARPIAKKQLRYALNDILYLYDLWQKQAAELRKRGRESWAKEEFAELEKAAYYQKDPHKEALNNNLMRALRPKEQLFLLRLFKWRHDQARSKDYSKEMILPSKMFSQIVRSISAGTEALKQNRRIPSKIASRHGEAFEKMYQEQATPDEKKVLKRISSKEISDPKQEILVEMLYLVLKYHCIDNEVSPNLVMSKAMLKKILNNNNLSDSLLGNGWRRELLGEDFTNWMLNMDRLQLKLESGKISFVIGDHGS